MGNTFLPFAFIRILWIIYFWMNMYQQILRYNLLIVSHQGYLYTSGAFRKPCYIHFNPVKHDYVQKASDWKYFSIHRFIQKGIISSDWACFDTLQTMNQFGE